MGVTAPLWEATAAAILAEMTAGRLADGARLLPEREMAAEMGVAVGTLRRALADIEARGLLERRQGSGNYVRAAGLGAQVYGMFRLEPEAPGAPAHPTARILSVSAAAMPPDLPALAPATIRIRRVRSLGGAVAALEEVWFGGVAGAPPADRFGDSLYLDAQRLLDLRIDAVEDRVGIGAAPDWAPDGAGTSLAPGAPCGHVLRRGRDRDGALREVSQTWFDAAAARYVSRAGRTLPPRPDAPHETAPRRARE